MKKVLSLILALTLVFAMTVPVLAVNEKSGTSTVTYTVGTKYYITIPATVTINDGTATQEVKVNNNSIIPADKSLTFTITGSTNYGGDPAGFRMQNSVGENVYLGYTITNAETPVAKDTAFLTATAAEAYTGKSVTLTYTTGTAESAGTYSDILTFTIGLADAP